MPDTLCGRGLPFGCWLLVWLLMTGHAAVAADAKPAIQRWLVRVDPIDLGARTHDEMPAEVVLDVGSPRSIDPTTFRVVMVDSTEQPLDKAITAESLPFRWYDDAIPYQFLEVEIYASTNNGRLPQTLRERGGYYLNAMGDGHKGRLAWTHTQSGHQPSWYSIECSVLDAGSTPATLPPQSWIGDGQARCAAVSTETVHSDQLRVDLDDWNHDGLIDLITGDSFGHIVWWPNLGTRQVPKFEYCRLIVDSRGQPLDVGNAAAPKLCDWDNDGDRDLVVGTERNRIVWYQNQGNDRDRRFEYRGLVMLANEPLILPITPLTKGSPAIFDLDYYPVLEFVDWDGDGDADLLAGGMITGCIFLYENLGSPPGTPPKLVLKGPLQADGALLNVAHWGAAPCAVDWDGDGDLDLLSGNMPFEDATAKGVIRYYENVGSKTAPMLRSAELKLEQLWTIPLGSPRVHDWDADGDLDLVISVRSDILLMENTGTRQKPRFDQKPRLVRPTWGPAQVVADQLLDWNGDGRVDLFNGYHVRLNAGGKNPWSWPDYIPLLKPGQEIHHRSGMGDEEHSRLLDDFDGDGIVDLLFGDWHGHVWWHRNRGTSAAPDFDIAGIKLNIRDGSAIKVGPMGLDPTKSFDALQGARTVVSAGDFDGDQRRDLVIGDTYGKLRYFRQLPESERAVKTEPVFAPGVEFGDLGIRLNVCTTDWNQDGKPDIIAGSAGGKVQVFLTSAKAERSSPFAAGFTPALPSIMQPRVLLGDINGDGDDDLYFPSTLGSCFVERSFLAHGYARGTIEKSEMK